MTRTTFQQRARCGIDSAGRGAKIVFEFLFSIMFGLPALLASFSAVLADTSEQEDDHGGSSAVTGHYVMTVPANNGEGYSLNHEQQRKDAHGVEEDCTAEAQPVIIDALSDSVT